MSGSLDLFSMSIFPSSHLPTRSNLRVLRSVIATGTYRSPFVPNSPDLNAQLHDTHMFGAFLLLERLLGEREPEHKQQREEADFGGA